MQEHPILFNGDMVRAILEGRKTQTRRPLKIQPPSSSCQIATFIESTSREDRKKEGKLHWVKLSPDGLSVIYNQGKYFACPFGQPGDRLWVRETWAWIGSETNGHYVYRSNYLPEQQYFVTWQPSIHMPRKASRIILEIDEIGAERIQDITEDEAMAEGIREWTKDGELYKYGHIEPGDQGCTPWSAMPKTVMGAYKSLWNGIYTEDLNWEANPWVWVVKFHKVEA
jgi:hypothetical protein